MECECEPKGITIRNFCGKMTLLCVAQDFMAGKLGAEKLLTKIRTTVD